MGDKSASLEGSAVAISYVVIAAGYGSIFEPSFRLCRYERGGGRGSTEACDKGLLAKASGGGGWNDVVGGECAAQYFSSLGGSVGGGSELLRSLIRVGLRVAPLVASAVGSIADKEGGLKCWSFANGGFCGFTRGGGTTPKAAATCASRRNELELVMWLEGAMQGGAGCGAETAMPGGSWNGAGASPVSFHWASLILVLTSSQPQPRIRCHSSDLSPSLCSQPACSI